MPIPYLQPEDAERHARIAQMKSASFTGNVQGIFSVDSVRDHPDEVLVSLTGWTADGEYVAVTTVASLAIGRSWSKRIMLVCSNYGRRKP